MHITFSTDGGDVFIVDVPNEDTPWSAVSTSLHRQTGVAPEAQRYMMNGRPLIPSTSASTVRQVGVTQEDMVVLSRAAAPTAAGVRRKRGAAGPSPAPLDPALYTSMTWESLPPGVHPFDIWKVLQVRVRRGERVHARARFSAPHPPPPRSPQCTGQ